MTFELTFEYGPLRGDEDMPAVAEMVGWAFGIQASDAESWLRKSGLEHVRVLRQSGKQVACLLLIPMGQFFGGRSVPMVGVAGVATAPEARGTGAATALMHATIKELHASGCPISTLYPATRTLYRRAGYEPAGGRFELTIPVKRIGTSDRGLDVRPITDADRAAIGTVYKAHARDLTGHLDRGEYIWGRVLQPRGQSARGFAVMRSSRIEGYLYLHEKPLTPPYFDLRITDMVGRSPEACRRLLTFLADHGTTANSASWFVGPGDALVQALPEVGYELRLRDHWMLRIVDVRAALEGRGYPEGIQAELHFDVRDDLIAENHGRFVLEIAGGEGKVRKGGRGKLRLDVRGLAPLYTGHLSPAALVASGLLEGPVAELRKAAAIFAGPAPWMPDMF